MLKRLNQTEVLNCSQVYYSPGTTISIIYDEMLVIILGFINGN
jgi:hypothetical protein